MNVTLLPADTYVVINQTILSEKDNKIISILYQPIIGAVATNLYFTFFSQLDNGEIASNMLNHHHLMNNTQLKLNDIIEARMKLEAVGLLKVYLKEGNVNSYIYQLFSPLDPNEFLNNPILSSALCNNIGNSSYERIVEYFKTPKINTKEYKNITCKFNDVFKISNLVKYSNEQELKKTSQLGIEFDPNIDLNNIFSLIPKELLNYKTLTNEQKELIYKLGFIYNFNDDTMRDIIRNSIGDNHLIDEELLRENSRNYYQFENNNKLPSVIYRNQPECFRTPITDKSKKSELIYDFETMSPYEYLLSKNEGIKPTKNDIKIIEYLLVDLKLNPGVVNVLIDYVLRINDNKLTKGFIESIGSQWSRNNVKTVTDAMEIASKENKKKNTPSKKNTQKQKPDWFNKKIESNEVTSEEEQAFLEKLRKKRSDIS